MELPLIRLASIALTGISLIVLFFSYDRVVIKRNPFGLTRWLFPLGIFVWGDGLLISIFWLLLSVAAFMLQDAWFWFCAISLFWLVRSLGEVVYWLLQQFMRPDTNHPGSLWGNGLYQGESIWFAYQVAWQCAAVVSGLVCAYSAYQWLIA